MDNNNDNNNNQQIKINNNNTNSSNSDNNKVDNKNSNDIKTPLEIQITSYRAMVAKSFDSNAKLNFKNIFNTSTASILTDTTAANTGSVSTKTAITSTENKSVSHEQRSLKLEVCSGAGEWIVAQVRIFTLKLL